MSKVHHRAVASVLALCALLALAPATLARDLPTTNPKREGMSQERLERIGAHMNTQVDKGIMVGGLGMIARNGKIVYQQNWGMSDREASIPMTEDRGTFPALSPKPLTVV